VAALRLELSEPLRRRLRATSRSFYLTLRVLPTAVRPQIGLAYLLARTADTIADTEIVPLEKRLAALQQWRERLLGQNAAPLDFGELAQHQGASAEKELLENAEAALAALKNFSDADQQLIRDVLQTILSGQELDLQRFSSATAGTITALETETELDDYTYRVAGCVGEFWTRLCRAHLFPHAKLDDAQFLADGIRFGKGLQLVNILRDLPADLARGRCYLPRQKLTAIGLTPADLLHPANANQLRPLYQACLDTAENHLRAGWNYTNTIPLAQFRVRLACAWPILIGARTIEKLRGENILDSRRRVKISRGEVRWILLRSILLCPFPGAWRRQWPHPSSGAAEK
jgi:farnesyl-diphosphate farnesyltransferase